ncbi:MAG: hypothetical protein HY763_13750 [Planctomycetes bacterium]|nr:hypothetical protein [Planctomycetota bacterium]
MTPTRDTSCSTVAVPTVDSIKGSLNAIEAFIDDGGGTTDATFYVRLAEMLRTLHGRIRIHHAATCLSASGDTTEPLPPECIEELTRLSGEHSAILGHLDRLVRAVDSMHDRPQEDRDVFFLRLRELIAIVRRHEAEEDRVFYLALWRDTGGES